MSERLRLDLAELRARQSRLSTAAQNLTAAFSAAECRRRMPLLQHTSVVYTWVNGSDPQYRELRKKHGGAGVVGGGRVSLIPFSRLERSDESLVAGELGAEPCGPAAGGPGGGTYEARAALIT